MSLTSWAEAETPTPPPTPDLDPFYTAPGSAAHVGDVIRSRPAVFTTVPVLNTPVAGVNSYQVIYQSENATNARVAVSGTVLVPTAPWTGGGSRPLITFGVGSRGLGDKCPPSYTLATGNDQDASATYGMPLQAALNKGWAVAISDMEGLGTPGQHTFEVGKSQGKALLNIARAAQRLPGTGLNANTPVGIWGYSQGGTSAGWAAELAPTYAPDLKVKGVAVGGAPADLIAEGRFVDGGPNMLVLWFIAIGFDAAYPELNLENHLNPTGTQLYNDSKDACLNGPEMAIVLPGTAGKHLTDLTTSDLLANPAWQNRLNENKLGNGKPNVPVFLYQGAFDGNVEPAQANALRDSWCAKGVNLTWKSIPAEHTGAAILGVPGAVSFLDARFKARPVNPSC